MSEQRTPAEILTQARRRDSLTKRSRVLATVDDMLARGTPITFAAVARAAKVSTWLVYADGVREHIERARTAQSNRQRRDRASTGRTSDASLRTDLELARAEIRALREERARLKAALQRRLGAELDTLHTRNQKADNATLADENRRLAAQNDQLTRENRALRRGLAETQDDLAAARQAVKDVIRNANRTPTATSPA